MTTPWGDRPAFIDPAAEVDGLDVGDAPVPVWLRLVSVVLLVAALAYVVAFRAGGRLDSEHNFRTGRAVVEDAEGAEGAATP